MDAQERPDQRAEDHDRERPEQREREFPCPRGLRRAIIGARKIPAETNDVATQNSASCSVPVPHQVVGEDRRQVDAEEARARPGSAVRRRRRTSGSIIDGVSADHGARLGGVAAAGELLEIELEIAAGGDGVAQAQVTDSAPVQGSLGKLPGDPLPVR